MKTTIPLFLPVLCFFNATVAIGQGKITFDNHNPGHVISPVYLPLQSDPGLIQTGNGPSDFPAGTTDWTGWTPVSGDGFSAQLFGAGGINAAESSLKPLFPITTFRGGVAAGFVNPVTSTLAEVIPGEPATIQMRVWDNKGGSIADWSTASAQAPGTEILGTSALINIDVIGGGQGIPSPMSGLQSFNLVYNIPEPASFIVIGVGTLAFWFCQARGRPIRL